MIQKFSVSLEFSKWIIITVVLMFIKFFSIQKIFEKISLWIGINDSEYGFFWKAKSKIMEQYYQDEYFDYRIHKSR